MQPLPLLAFFHAIVTPALATSLLVPRNTNATPPYCPPSQYFLQTRVIGPGHADKNNLYLSSYHTGAGLNDVTLVGDVGNAVECFCIDGHQQFYLENSFPWGLQMGGDTNYAAWEFATIEGGEGSEGFYFDDAGLQWNVTEGGFGGWLVCDWWHGLPQLFWKNVDYPEEAKYPSSCAEVNLVAQEP